MTKEEELLYAAKYKKTSRILGVVISVFIMVFAVSIFGVGIFLAVYTRTVPMIVLGSVMGLVGIMDFILGFKFKGYTDRRIANIKDREACMRYCKIHGYNRK